MSDERSKRSFPRPFSIRIDRPSPGVMSIAISGELDLACAPIVFEAFRAAFEDPDAPALVLDLTELDFIDSWGVRTAFDAAKSLKKRDGSQLIVVGGGMQVKRVFSIIHISRVVHLVDSVDEALIAAEAYRADASGSSQLPQN